jgi:RNA polymerase sigma-70 factor (ECF subfamily)
MGDRKIEQSQWFLESVLPNEADLRAWLQTRFNVIRDVDDVIQETYTRIMKAYASGPIVNPRAFLFVTARNISLNYIRHSQYEQPPGAKEIDPMSVVDQAVTPSDSAVYSEEIQLLIKAIQSLPKRCRQVMTLRKIYGLSQAEVAKKLGISEHTVEAQGSIGLKKCIRYFQRLGYATNQKR